jgi:hypothetical protein
MSQLVNPSVRPFHTGIRVPDLGRAMEELGVVLGCTWAEPRFVEGQSAWTPEGGHQHLPLHYTYSCEGPLHYELLQGPPGSIWDGTVEPGLHHVGVWVDDVAGATEDAVARGWALRLAGLPPEQGYGGYTYVQAPGSNLLLEYVNAAYRERFERWWAGGDL